MDLWIRVLEQGTGLIVPRPVVLYHLHSGQVTTRRRPDGRRPRRGGTQLRRPALVESGHARALGRRRQHMTRRVASWAADAAGARCPGRRAFCGSPTRTLGAGGILLRRARLRRRSGMLDRHGEHRPSRCSCPVRAGPVDEARDLRGMSSAAALARAGGAPAASRRGRRSWLQGVAARLLGFRHVTRDARGSRARAGDQRRGPAASSSNSS